MTTPITNFTATDIARTYSPIADRVSMHVVDETTVLAVGFRADRTATGRLACIYREEDADGEFWVFEARMAKFGLDCAAGIVDDSLLTNGDLSALVRWLRGDA